MLTPWKMLMRLRSQPSPEDPRALRHKLLLPVRAKELCAGEALAVNLSQSGLCLTSRSPLALRQLLHLELDIGPFPLRVKGSVTRCTKDNKDLFQIGIDLSHSAAHIRQAVRRYLLQLNGAIARSA